MDEALTALYTAWHNEHQWWLAPDRAFLDAYNAGRASRDDEVSELTECVDRLEKQILEYAPFVTQNFGS